MEQFRGAARVSLREGLETFPRELFDLADSLEVLDLSGNRLSSLPDDLPRLHKLRVIFCSDNLFTELPAVLGQCPNLSMVGFKANQIHTVPAAAFPKALRWLILTDNQIHSLPPELGHCTQLQKLMLAGNRLHHLPEELVNCRQLELLRISANRLSALPLWLFELPRLSWLAYAGNPFCQALEDATLTDPATGMDPNDPSRAGCSSMVRIPWQHLRLGPVLGEGASGVIYQAHLVASANRRPVAVKLFKGAITSDGLPMSEMAACIRAGNHPSLIEVLGQIEHHPENIKGLVMALIPPDFKNLAGPPSLSTCTRDVYDEGKRFTVEQVMAIISGVASAAAQLHARGVNHGDLYAHNILHDDRGHAMLGDFGAASLFDPEDIVMARGLGRIEARALGYLFEELLSRCDPAAPPDGA